MPIEKKRETPPPKERQSVILLAAGKGARFKAKIPKQFMKLNGKPLIAWSLIPIAKQLPFDQLIISCEPSYQKAILKICQKETPALIPLIQFSQGGATRQQSVLNALEKCTAPSLLLHESARPCAPVALFQEIQNTPTENATCGEEIPFTVLKKETTTNQIIEILVRDQLFNVQLPQKFNTAALLEAHKKAIVENRTFTDDSSLLFAYGNPVTVIKGSPSNIKITHPQDLKIAKEILKRDK